ncbi:MAG: Gfo/Idh/MocA family oxidoreductase [Chloroflexi bacterium]|nr:Gfo/Idh/MocA family oxidoreductase [Chloroflexota bacterium]OJV88159.1 MAG: NAD-binding protein [Chloroflexi bacterium 54-19]
MAKVRWGILSTANIGVNKVIPAMQKGQYSEVVGLASRNLASAQAAAAKLGLAKAYGSYEELLADPEIDAIYNPLPNDLHISWSIKALEAGKHVLCEKPLALNADEAQLLADAGQKYPHLKLMEAFMYRHNLQWQATRKMVQEGRIGDLKTIQSFFSYFLDDPNNIRNIPENGGGGLFDIGCYNISLSRFIFGKEPERVLGLVDFDPNLKTDRLASVILDFGNGTSSTFTCSTQLVPFQRVNIFGTTGRIEIEIPFNAPEDRPNKVWVTTGGQTELIDLPTVDQYTIQGDLFSQAVLDDTPVPTPIEDGVANMRVIDRVFESARTNTWA